MQLATITDKLSKADCNSPIPKLFPLQNKEWEESVGGVWEHGITQFLMPWDPPKKVFSLQDIEKVGLGRVLIESVPISEVWNCDIVYCRPRHSLIPRLPYSGMQTVPFYCSGSPGTPTGN